MDNYKGKGHGSSQSNFQRMEESIKERDDGREKVNGENVKIGGKKE